MAKAKYAFEIGSYPHAALSASGASRWLACPGSVRLSVGMPNVTTEYAAHGTTAHFIAAKCQTDGGSPNRWLGRMALVEGFEIEIDQDMVDALEDFLAHVRRDTTTDDQVWIEVDLTPALCKLHPKLGGNADRVRFKRAERVLRVTDLKMGSGVSVEATENKQLMTYALGALLKFQHLNPTRVEVEIAQPRLDHPEGRYRRWAFDTVDIVDFAADLVEGALATEAPDAPTNPGEKQCRFCPAAAQCPALEKKSQELMTAQFDNLDTIAPDRLAQMLAIMPALESRIEAIRAYAYSEAEKGVPIPGYKLVAKRANRAWTDTDAVQRKLIHRPEYYTQPVLKPPAQIEKVMGKAEFGRVFNDSGLVQAISSGHTLVPVSDPRPEVKLLTADAFDNEEQEK